MRKYAVVTGQVKRKTQNYTSMKVHNTKIQKYKDIARMQTVLMQFVTILYSSHQPEALPYPLKERSPSSSVQRCKILL